MSLSNPHHIQEPKFEFYLFYKISPDNRMPMDLQCTHSPRMLIDFQLLFTSFRSLLVLYCQLQHGNISHLTVDDFHFSLPLCLFLRFIFQWHVNVCLYVAVCIWMQELWRPGASDSLGAGVTGGRGLPTVVITNLFSQNRRSISLPLPWTIKLSYQLSQ